MESSARSQSRLSEVMFDEMENCFKIHLIFNHQSGFQMSPFLIISNWSQVINNLDFHSVVLSPFRTDTNFLLFSDWLLGSLSFRKNRCYHHGHETRFYSLIDQKIEVKQSKLTATVRVLLTNTLVSGQLASTYGRLPKILFQLPYTDSVFLNSLSGRGHFQGLRVRFQLCF